MSYSLVFPSQWDDFESMFDKLATDRYGPAPNGNHKGPEQSGPSNRAPESRGTSEVSPIQRPKMDIVETEDAFVVSTELPGAKKEDIAIEFQNGRLTVRSETKAPIEYTQGSVRVSERVFGTFGRTVAVPSNTSYDQIKATFNDGVLELKVPKLKNDQTSHKIQIS
ncbi:hypothetical protein CROQUDRAFT_63140 [Cronartium quercuum f. sp. fusiforme G11]|uniref:SHSP domain-containing protein n=1 Tax=Cronartium quercuum f. sp. fusiforme G11 TaxID=708437 RepID=A0A9P6NMD2_9BASI|nr:hypothetical protein CROQUDRAFT_63140 [Cronartium quercuum f. sp. fusiforme G11]